jgi:O-antigen ligase
MLGFGQRSFVKKYPEFYNQYKGALLWHAHNTFLNITFQTGLQGLALFIYLLYSLLKYNYNMGREERIPWRKFYFQATFMMIIIFFVRNLTDDFFKDDSALMFWFLSGVAVSVRKG